MRILRTVLCALFLALFFNLRICRAQTQEQVDEAPSTFSSSSQDAIRQLESLRSQGKALMLHLYEWMGKESNIELRLPGEPISATVTNLMEKEEGLRIAAPVSRKLMVPVHPYEIVTVRVEYPDTTQ